jgi:hypothetical protein
MAQLTPDEAKLKDLYTWYFAKTFNPSNVTADSPPEAIFAAILYIEYGNKLQAIKDKENS